jgi:hypothetical protein
MFRTPGLKSWGKDSLEKKSVETVLLRDEVGLLAY